MRPQAGLAKLRHPTGRLAEAARVNDTSCERWTPRLPVRMYAAHGDPEAVFANSVECRKKLAGAEVTLTDVGDVDHITSLVRSIPRVAEWFSALS